MCVCVYVRLQSTPNGLRVSLMRCADSSSGIACSPFVVDGPALFVCCALVARNLRASVQAEALVGMEPAVICNRRWPLLCKAAKISSRVSEPSTEPLEPLSRCCNPSPPPM